MKRRQISRKSSKLSPPSVTPFLSAAGLGNKFVGDSAHKAYVFGRLLHEHQKLDEEIESRISRGVSTWAEADKIAELKRRKLHFKESLEELSALLAGSDLRCNDSLLA